MKELAEQKAALEKQKSEQIAAKQAAELKAA